MNDRPVLQWDSTYKALESRRHATRGVAPANSEATRLKSISASPKTSAQRQ